MAFIAVIALVLAALFTGAALYISLVEQPVRLMLRDEPALAQWQPSYTRALPIQASLAVLGGVSAWIACYLSTDWRWAVGGAVLLANWPFTLLVIMPVNKRLKATPPSEADVETRQLLLHWGKLHAWRSLLGSVATGIFAWALIAPGL